MGAPKKEGDWKFSRDERPIKSNKSGSIQVLAIKAFFRANNEGYHGGEGVKSY